MDPKSNVEIVIPVHNRRETTLQALRSLSRIESDTFTFHVIIVDDGSTDGTTEVIRKQFPDVQIVIGDGTLHYAAGTNRGIVEALNSKPDYVLVANDDSIFHPAFLESKAPRFYKKGKLDIRDRSLRRST
jgi:GT2 family glycosyltransferase